MTSRNPYFWARFAQPVRLLHSADEAARATVLDALAQACLTMLRESRYLARSGEEVPAAVARCLTMTYATELRAERSDRASGIVHANIAFYRDVADLAAHVAANESMQSPRFHGVRKLTGKVLSVARLVKASFTFEGGMDYLSWKIERHSGQRIELSDWQRRHPIIAGILLLRRLRKSDAVR